jgi:hypothetical protein
LPAGDEALEAVKMVWSRDRISQTGVAERKDDARDIDSNLLTNPGSGRRADEDPSAHLLRELELLSDASAAVSPPTSLPGHPPRANPPSVVRSKRMSSVSEQDHLNPRDPLYYAPRSLRERSATRGASPETQFSPASFDSQLESAVSDALRHPLDPELMNEPDLESKKALWTIAARFAAAIGVAALVALFFVVAVPGSRQSDGETPPSALSSVAQSIKTTLGEASPKPAINEFQALLASTPPSAPAATEQDSQLLKQFMQWREKPDPATPQRTTP